MSTGAGMDRFFVVLALRMGSGDSESSLECFERGLEAGYFSAISQIVGTGGVVVFNRRRWTSTENPPGTTKYKWSFRRGFAIH